MSQTDAITIRGLTKTFGPKVAVNNLNLSVPTGSLCGFIGPNGAGKTTTIRMIMSIIFPDSGELSVLGRASAVESKDRIGYLPEERGVYRKMRVLPFLTYMAKLKGVDTSAASGRARHWLERVDLKDVGKKRCEELSKGMQQKVQFIAAVIHEPDLLILDEVFTGLDPENRVLMRGLIEEQHRGTGGAGRTIVFSTHSMYEAEQLCDRVFMICDGHKVLDDTLAGIRARFDPKTIVVEPFAEVADHDAGGMLAGMEGVQRVERDRGAFVVSVDDPAQAPALMAAIAARLPVRRIELKRVNLEDVFMELVRAGGNRRIRRDELRSPAEQAAQEAAHA